jgi:ABC-type Fe3+-hydroxamate transport system substrate-binding protein
VAVKIRDDMGREVIMTRDPRRIVSLVPSDTYTLFALGAGERLVGRTRYCVLPAGEVDRIAVVGGTKDVEPDAVADLAPDLVIANQEENARAPLEEMARRGLPLYVSFPRRVAEGVAHMARLARLLGLARAPAVEELARRAYQVLRSDAELEAAGPEMPRAFVPIWKDPLMTFHQDTFASDMLVQAGCANAFADRERRYPLAADLGRRSPLPADRLGDRDTRYPRVTDEEVVARAPDLVLLPDEPYEFGPADLAWASGLDLPAARRGAVALADGKDLFWYGAWSVDALPRLRAQVARLTGRSD